MMTQNADKKREQIQMFCMDDMVPQDHLLRIIDKAINWNFIWLIYLKKIANSLYCMLKNIYLAFHLYWNIFLIYISNTFLFLQQIKVYSLQ